MDLSATLLSSWVQGHADHVGKDVHTQLFQNVMWSVRLKVELCVLEWVCHSFPLVHFCITVFLPEWVPLLNGFMKTLWSLHMSWKMQCLWTGLSWMVCFRDVALHWCLRGTSLSTTALINRLWMEPLLTCKNKTLSSSLCSFELYCVVWIKLPRRDVGQNNDGTSYCSISPGVKLVTWILARH